MKKRFALLTIFCLTLNLVSYSQISFNASTYSGCTPLPVNFSNTSSSGVHFDWYFGDGTATYDSYNASHTYTYASSFTVTMYAYDALYNYVGMYSATIDVSGQPYGLSIPELACPMDQINFWSPISASFYTWNFGDGNIVTTTDSYINHAFASPGIYAVSMSFFDQTCGITYSVSDTIAISSTIPYFGGYPSLYIYETTVCPNTTVYAGVGGNYLLYNWDFGNGTFASSPQQASTTYSSVGLYDLQVTLTNGCGVDTTLVQQITVDNSVPAPSVPITGPTEVCVGEEFFVAANGPQDLTYTWDMGDGSPVQTDIQSYHYHTYAAAGPYTIELVIENQCGNTTTQLYSITASTTAPVYDAQLDIYPDNVCPGDAINYWLPWSYDYYIDFGDGTGTTEGYSHEYTSTGTYPVYAIVQNACGSTATLYDTVYVLDNLPIASNVYMGANPDPSCPQNDVQFYAASGFSQYDWSFGDGFTTSAEQANHPYQNTGTYNYSVTITNGCGADTTLFSSIDIVNNLPLTNLDWNVYADEACPGSTVYMSVDEGDDISVVWDFGDGSAVSTDPTASHIYDTPGNYTITLVALNGCGSDSTVTHNIAIDNTASPYSPSTEISVQSPGCVGDNLYFAIVPAGIGTFTWDFGDGNTGSSDQLIYVEGQPIAVGFHAYSAPGTYNAVLTITNACGNSFDTTLTVVVDGPGSGIPADVFFWHDEAEITCEGQPVTFYAVGGGSYMWDFGDGSGNLITYSSLSPVEHVYDNDGSYTITVNGFNACGNSDINNETIVIPDSEINLITNTVANSDCGINNGVAIVSASGGTQPYSYSWTNGDQSVLADSLGSGIYVVSVTDNNGCSTEAIAAVSDDQGPVILLENIVHNECFGQDNGVISVSVLGGAPPYVISWSNGDVLEDIFNLEAGPYEIFVTDANGCFAAESFTIQEPEESVISIYSQPATCNGVNGEATAVINNGTPPFNYIWPNTTGSSNVTSGLAPGVYELMVIDGNTCLIQKEFVVNEQNGPVIVTDSITDATCSGDLSGVYISTIGGTSPFSYTWSNATAAEDLTGVLPGEYTVEVEGADGCSSYMFFDVEMSAPDQTSICMVTVDTLTNSNIVVWNPVNSPDVVSYNIYKESSESGLYFLVANQSADSISEYYDYASNPAIRSWRYKVAAVDDCNNIAELSDPHKTIHLTSNLGVGGVVNLIWDHYNGFAYETYYIHRYHPSTGWMVIDSVGSLNISYTDLTPPSDSNLVYVVEVLPPAVCTAFKVQDHNSSRSNKSAINMPGGPTDLGIEPVEKTALSIYPNPTSGMVQLMYSSVISELRIYDLSGQLVYRTNNASNTLAVDCSGFARGVYTIQLTTENGTLYSKLVKQ
ncbi:MAG: PKD domain-containing protein [Bacteroidetes bacterium]|nr:PKD domain-containing protein [Bacteroidota bacterium]